ILHSPSGESSNDQAKWKTTVLDNRTGSDLEVARKKEQTSGRYCAHLETQRRRNSAKSVQPWLVARVTRRSVRPIGGFTSGLSHFKPNPTSDISYPGTCALTNSFCVAKLHYSAPSRSQIMPLLRVNGALSWVWTLAKYSSAQFYAHIAGKTISSHCGPS